MKNEFKNVGLHPEDLDDGRVVGVGETVNLTKEQLENPHNSRLVDEGILLSTDDKKTGGGEPK